MFWVCDILEKVSALSNLDGRLPQASTSHEKVNLLMNVVSKSDFKIEALIFRWPISNQAQQAIRVWIHPRFKDNL